MNETLKTFIGCSILLLAFAFGFYFSIININQFPYFPELCIFMCGLISLSTIGAFFLWLFEKSIKLIYKTKN